MIHSHPSPPIRTRHNACQQRHRQRRDLQCRALWSGCQSQTFGIWKTKLDIDAIGLTDTDQDSRRQGFHLYGGSKVQILAQW